MNLNGEEKRIRRLFDELSLHEQGRAPEFATVLAAADLATARSRNRQRPLRFAMAMSVLLAVLVMAIAILQGSKPQQIEPLNQALAPDHQPEGDTAVATNPLTANQPRKRTARQRRKQRPDQTAIAMRSLFAWRSPTASLLKTPTDELLRSLPRLGESFQTIKSYSPEQFN